MKRYLSFVITILLTVGFIQAQIFYKIEGNGLHQPSYLFGTHHLAPISVIEKNNVPEYFDHATQVVGEIDLTIDPMELAAILQPYMIAPVDSTLSKVISAEDFKLINENFKRYAPMPGMDMSMLEPMKPMVVSSIVTVGIMSELMPEFDQNAQLDTYFINKGKEQGKTIKALETPEFQGEILYNFTPISVQAEALVDMLKDPEDIVKNARKLNEAYDKGDLDAMLEISEEDDDHSEFMIALLDKRNADWLTKLPGILKEGPAFIAVGALHLAGNNGLIAGLRNLGFTVTPVE